MFKIISLLLLSCVSITQAIAACSGGYPDQATSAYTLPYSVGQAYLVGQGNCTDGSHEIGFDQAYAYDFDMPIGTDVVATRGGVVVALEERYVDGNRTSGQENFVVVEHTDGLVSGYYHLTRNGVIPALGARVQQGDVIGKSGDTGDSSEPHLHFEVLDCQDCDTVPINFINTRAHTDGLVDQASYLALSFDKTLPATNSIVGQLLLLLEAG
jgi:hypothetical protein